MRSVFMREQVVDDDLRHYVETAILPIYDRFDAAHGRNHAEKVIESSLGMAQMFDVNINMVYTVAAFHDVGLLDGRETHHLVSGRILRADNQLLRWFSSSQIEIMAQAVEDHRASAAHTPRSIYGCIVADADRNMDIDVIVTRTLQYGFANYPQLGRDEHINRALNHLRQKYGRNGYLRLWISGSSAEKALHDLWNRIDDSDSIRRLVADRYDKLMAIGCMHHF